MSKRGFDDSGRPTPDALCEEEELQKLFPAYRGVDDDYVHAGRDALERWWDWKFGIRVHWSIYSVTGSGNESWPLGKPGDVDFREQYESLARWWNPSLYKADEWCDLFARAGLRYFTFTTKHHDGFSMFDTKTKVRRRFVHAGPNAGRIAECDLHYSITEGPFGRDVVRELVDAARARDLGIGLYFSHIDWFDCDFRIDECNYIKDPAYTRQSDPEGFRRMMARHREQIREICANYGKVDLLSFDMGFPDGIDKRAHGNGLLHGIRDDIVETVKMARRLQPGMLMRRRGIDPYGDYKTPEGVVPTDPEAAAGGQDMPWQVIYPGSDCFSHKWHDHYKPASWVITNLIDITSKGGNFQVGYGPMPTGEWAPGIVRRLEEVGRWLNVNGEGIYCTRPYRVFKEGDSVRFTRTKDRKTVYAFILGWPEGPFAGGPVRLESVRAKPGSAITMLGLDHRFKYTQDDKTLAIEIPDWFRDPAKRPCEIAYAFKISLGE